MEELFLGLIRVALCTQESLERVPTVQEWQYLYDMAEKQSVVGVCLKGIQKLGKNCRPGFDLYMQWVAISATIQQRNDLLDNHCVNLQKNLCAHGMDNCILKGQGNALLYEKELAGLRQSGDIDVWIDGGFKKVYAFVNSVTPTKDVRDNHIQLHVYSDVAVEVHYRPASMRNPIYNHHLQRFFARSAIDCFKNHVTFGNGNKITVPTATFNMVYQLVHIYIHLFTEGVGLRHLLDYYFVLKTRSHDNSLSEKEVICTVHDIGLDRLAAALMWVLAHAFGLEEQYMPWKPNDKDGHFLLDEVMLSGNFGMRDERMSGLNKSRWKSFWLVNGKTFRLRRFDRWAWFWSPLWRMYHFAWRKINKYE